MRKRSLKRALLVTLVLLLLAGCSSAFPSIKQISSLTDEEAEKLLIGKTEQEINDNWGEPDSMLSGFYGDIYVYEERQIVIYYDGALIGSGQQQTCLIVHRYRLLVLSTLSVAGV